MTEPTAAREPPRPLDAIMLSVGDGHWLYVEETGRRGGVPALFLHGGPGSGCQHWHRNLFGSERFHGILFDQRGAGRSHPYLSLAANTTQHLVDDIERIRAHFGFDRWLVAGGSWGSTLAVAYAEAHPERVAGLVLRAVFLGTRQEVMWAFEDGPRRFRPELYADFRDRLPEADRADPIAAYVQKLTNPDPVVHGPAARLWGAYERALSEIAPAAPLLPVGAGAGRIPPTALVEAHYIARDFFLAPGQLLDEAERLSGIPGVIVQGRYDLLCPPAAAFELHRRWRASELRFMEGAGHAMSEPGVEPAMAAALQELAARAWPK